jgi:hypothetical protein
MMSVDEEERTVTAPEMEHNAEIANNLKYYVIMFSQNIFLSSHTYGTSYTTTRPNKE